MLKKNTHVTLNHDRYCLLESLGAGGQGSIWKVRRVRDQSEWVMKSVLIVSNAKKVQSNKQRLQNEINFLESLDNAERSYIVPCIDSGLIEDKCYGALPAWIMPYYPHMLEDKMPPYPDNIPIPTVCDSLKWIKQIAMALQTTHAFKTAGVTFIHRDIKAANMMLTAQEDIRLIDFGISRETRNDHDTNTRSYSPKSYAPEQMLAHRYDANKAFYSIGSYTDIYSLGTVIYRLFTGVEETEAQVRLANAVVQKDHTISVNAGGKGKLGEIGGLSSAEYVSLVEEIAGRLDDEAADEDGTQVTTDDQGLPNYDIIAESFSDFVRLMLHAEYKQRPSASDVITWITTLQHALSPKLNSIQLHFEPKTVHINQSIPLTVISKGKGLAADAIWMTLSVNGKRVRQPFEPIAPEQQQYGFLLNQQQHWHITLPPINATGQQQIRIEAMVNEVTLVDQIEISLNLAAKDKQKTTATKKSLKHRLFLILFVLILGAIIYGALTLLPYSDNPDTQKLSQWESELNSDNSPQRLAAWRKLKRLSTTTDDLAAQHAKRILNDFEKDTYTLFDSNNLQQQQAAISRLTLMANSGITTAKIKLGLAYQTGKAVPQDWAKAWQFHHDAGDMGKTYKNSLEKAADDILQNHNAQPETRAQAYQVIEHTANTAPAGDPAQQWMEYRYRVGDGVAIDAAQANAWQQRYEGMETMSQPIGENNP